MKWVRFIYKGSSAEVSASSNLTVGKIYKVVNHNSDTKPHNNPT